MYFKGQGGLEKDFLEAERLWFLAAHHDVPTAHFNLGLLYKDGHEGVPQNLPGGLPPQPPRPQPRPYGSTAHEARARRCRPHRRQARGRSMRSIAPDHAEEEMDEDEVSGR